MWERLWLRALLLCLWGGQALGARRTTAAKRRAA